MQTNFACTGTSFTSLELLSPKREYENNRIAMNIGMYFIFMADLPCRVIHFNMLSEDELANRNRAFTVFQLRVVARAFSFFSSSAFVNFDLPMPSGQYRNNSSLPGRNSTRSPDGTARFATINLETGRDK